MTKTQDSVMLGNKMNIGRKRQEIRNKISRIRRKSTIIFLKRNNPDYSIHRHSPAKFNITQKFDNRECRKTNTIVYFSILCFGSFNNISEFYETMSQIQPNFFT